MSILGLAGAVASDDGHWNCTVDDGAAKVDAIDNKAVEERTGLEDVDALSLMCPDAGTDPKNFTLSDFSGREEDIGAEASIDPKFPVEPVRRRRRRISNNGLKKCADQLLTLFYRTYVTLWDTDAIFNGDALA